MVRTIRLMNSNILYGISARDRYETWRDVDDAVRSYSAKGDCAEAAFVWANGPSQVKVKISLEKPLLGVEPDFRSTL